MRAAVLAACLALAGAQALALDLGEAYRLAREADARYQAVAARTEAAGEGVKVARAKLLPQLGASGSVGRLWVERQFASRSLPLTPTDSWQWGVSAVQPLYRPGEWAAYQQAKAVSESAELALGDAAMQLFARLAKAYLAALDAAAQLAAARSDADRYAAILKQAQAAFYRGQGSLVEVEEAKARLDAARAKVLKRQGELEIAERSLSLLVGRPASAGELADLAGRHVLSQDILAKPPEDWVAEARQANLALASLRKQVEAARHRVEQQLAGHKPTLDVVAGYRQSLSESEITLEQQFKTASVNLRATLPLFTGLGTSAAVRQAKAQLNQAEWELEQSARQLEQAVLDAYTRVRFGESQVAALDQAVRSAEQAVAGTRKGMQAGTRHLVDVLNAEQQAAEVRAQRTDAIYQLLGAVVDLLAAVTPLPDQALAWLQGQAGAD